MIYYLPLEAYQSRYTDSLAQWTLDAFHLKDIPITPVYGVMLTDKIQVGKVLDARGRSYYSLTQMAKLMALSNEFKDGDVIYFDDMFTPGYEALPYLVSQIDTKVGIVGRCHAQSVDADDFTFPMRRWMRHYEELFTRTASAVCLASTLHKEAMEIANLDNCPIHVVGLPFSSKSVQNKVSGGKFFSSAFKDKQDAVIFSSRFDTEKQPHFYLDMIEQFHGDGSFSSSRINPAIKFYICTGNETLRSNDPTAILRAHKMAAKGLVHIVENATKEVYYNLLNSCKVQFNCAKQDWISYTACEASALGTITVAPAYKAFPETLLSSERQLYTPWSIRDALKKIEDLMKWDDNQSAAWIAERVAGSSRLDFFVAESAEPAEVIDKLESIT